MKRSISVLSALTLILAMVGSYVIYAWTPMPVVDDPLIRMPGTQPGGTTLEAPGRCQNCHADYDPAVEPGYNWKGSMMAQAARDFLFWTCMTVAAQDSIWAIGRPNATDICERCHFPQGWLEGRSDPTNASAMTGADYDGVQCDSCHTMFDPFFQATYDGARGDGDWDETNLSSTPSDAAALATFDEDVVQAAGITFFHGGPYYADNLPPTGYVENGSGQYYVSAGSQKRASFADAAARHKMFYSRHHKSKYFCDACHDVSNPILANLVLGNVGVDEDINDFLGTERTLWTEEHPASSYFHVERTFSEFMLSDYAQPDGAPGMGPFSPQVFETSAPDNNIRMCQDCHMRDVTGVACTLQGVPVRPDESVEHPNSGLPLHDLTGGNAWVSSVLASTVPGSPNYDQTNADLLNGLHGPLTLDLTQGEGIDPAALLAGVDRARQQLLLAASIPYMHYDPATGELAFRVQNQTGHKLISGFPEGRRMFVSIQAYQEGNLIYEVNPYDATAGTLKGLHYPYQPGLPAPEPLADHEVYVDELVYETHPESTLTGETQTFHFALATGRHKDNRIPPMGFNIAAAPARLSQPVYYRDEVDVGSAYFTAEEYAGGYDEVNNDPASPYFVPDLAGFPVDADYVEISLYYQTTSREYVEFLRDETRGTGNLTLPDPDPGTPGNQAYVIQTDPFFAQLASWGDTMWDLWTHNMNLDGATPFLMTQAAFATFEADIGTIDGPAPND